jgi:Ca2+-binding RTX toxin-like protein
MGDGSDLVWSGAGADVIVDPDGRYSEVNAGPGDDVVLSQYRGRPPAGQGFYVSARAGDDVIRARSAGLIVQAGAGNDVMKSGRGYGEFGIGTGNDVVIAGAGGSQAFGFEGEGDAYYGGAASDSVMYGSAPSAIHVSLSTGEGHLKGSSVTDTLVNVEGVYGSRFNDFLAGNRRGNSLYGDAGNDSLYGRGGADILNGNDGDDYLDGGSPVGTPDPDRLLGERGQDECVNGRALEDSCES